MDLRQVHDAALDVERPLHEEVRRPRAGVEAVRPHHDPLAFVRTVVEPGADLRTGEEGVVDGLDDLTRVPDHPMPRDDRGRPERDPPFHRVEVLGRDVERADTASRVGQVDAVDVLVGRAHRWRAYP
jgi:hypothetical protein